MTARGYDPGRVTHVVLSHLHYDHVGGAHLFPSAQVLVGAGELDHAGGGTDPYCRAGDVERVLASSPRELPAGDTDLFGDGSVVLLVLPGHTPGQLGLQVRLRVREDATLWVSHDPDDWAAHSSAPDGLS